MFSYGPGELHGRDIETRSAEIPPGTRREVADWIQKAADSGQPQRFEWHCKARDGGLFWADVTVRSASIGNVGEQAFTQFEHQPRRFCGCLSRIIRTS
jgi:hypothetical protein